MNNTDRVYQFRDNMPLTVNTQTYINVWRFKTVEETFSLHYAVLKRSS